MLAREEVRATGTGLQLPVIAERPLGTGEAVADARVGDKGFRTAGDRLLAGVSFAMILRRSSGDLSLTANVSDSFKRANKKGGLTL